jgi:hypothetical protein
MVAWIGCYLQQADKLSTSSRDQAGVFHPNTISDVAQEAEPPTRTILQTKICYRLTTIRVMVKLLGAEETNEA